MTIYRRHILVSSCSIALALVFQIAPISGEEQLEGQRPVEINLPWDLSRPTAIL